MPQQPLKQADSQQPLIDFDSWSQLAQSDPEAFEARRSQFIEQMIQRMPSDKQHRMRCLQWKIDQVRARASNPLAACIKLSEMMWDSLAGPGGLRDVLEHPDGGGVEPRRTAAVVDFDRAPRQR